MTAGRRLASVVRAFPGTTVVVMGDVMLDEYTWGEVRRISPEAPVPVVEVGRRTSIPGGAGNTAVGIVSLGGTAILGGLVGADASAQRLREALKSLNIGSDGLIVQTERPTTTKSRIVAGSQQVVRADLETRDAPDESAEAELLAWAEEAVAAADALIISDYAKGVVTFRVAHMAIAVARDRHIPVVVDPKGSDFSKYRGATVVTPNLAEAEHAMGRRITDEQSLHRVGRDLSAVLGDSSVLITRGAQGMSLFRPGNDAVPVDIPATARNVFDVTGAGDTVVATLALALARGASLIEGARLATLAAGIVIGKLGTASALREELLAEAVR